MSSKTEAKMYKKFDFIDFESKYLDVYLKKFDLPEYLNKWLAIQFAGHLPLSKEFSLNFERLTEREHSFVQLSLWFDQQTLYNFGDYLEKIFYSAYDFDDNDRDQYTNNLTLYNQTALELAQLLHFYQPQVYTVQNDNQKDYAMHFLFQNDQKEVLSGKFVVNNLLPLDSYEDYVESVYIDGELVKTDYGFVQLEYNEPKRIVITTDYDVQMLDVFGAANILDSYIPHYKEGNNFIVYIKRPVLLYFFKPKGYVEAKFEQTGYVLNMPFKNENGYLYIKTRQITEPIVYVKEGGL